VFYRVLASDTFGAWMHTHTQCCCCAHSWTRSRVLAVRLVGGGALVCSCCGLRLRQAGATACAKRES